MVGSRPVYISLGIHSKAKGSLIESLNCEMKGSDVERDLVVGEGDNMLCEWRPNVEGVAWESGHAAQSGNLRCSQVGQRLHSLLKR